MLLARLVVPQPLAPPDPSRRRCRMPGRQTDRPESVRHKPAAIRAARRRALRKVTIPRHRHAVADGHRAARVGDCVDRRLSQPRGASVRDDGGVDCAAGACKTRHIGNRSDPGVDCPAGACKTRHIENRSEGLARTCCWTCTSLQALSRHPDLERFARRNPVRWAPCETRSGRGHPLFIGPSFSPRSAPAPAGTPPRASGRVRAVLCTRR